MIDKPELTPTAVEYPTLTLHNAVDERGEKCTRTFILRYTYASNYQLAKWGLTIPKADWIALAAAMCGTYVAPGKWRNEGFERPVDLADMMEVDEETDDLTPLIEAAKLAAKNRFPALEFAARPTQGQTTEQPKTTETVSSAPGLSPEPFSESKTPNSGV